MFPTHHFSLRLHIRFHSPTQRGRTLQIPLNGAIRGRCVQDCPYGCFSGTSITIVIVSCFILVVLADRNLDTLARKTFAEWSAFNHSGELLGRVHLKLV